MGVETRITKIPDSHIPTNRPRIGLLTMICPTGEELHFIEDRRDRRERREPSASGETFVQRLQRPFFTHPNLAAVLQILPR